ncbi:MAG: DUF488 domain-containing protein [Thermomicrobiales bacterium]
MTVFTIGHSSVPAEEFLDLLDLHHAAMVLDVRSAPHSRYVPHFNRESLQARLAKHGLAYEWAGDTLGGRPDDPTCYYADDVRGKLDQATVRERPWYQQGIHRLVELALQQRTVLLCSEEDPRRCHRHHLVARSLLELGVQVLHIRRSGELEDARSVHLAEQGGGPHQLILGGIAA